MVSALLAACIASSSQASCKTHDLGPGTYKIIAADSKHRTQFTATTSSAANAEHEATIEPFIGSATCAKLAPLSGAFSLFPGASHEVPGQLDSGQALCVKVYKGTVAISLAPGSVQSEVTWESKTTAFRSLASSCSVHATRLHCTPLTLTTGTYRIATATTDDVQVGIGFIGGSYRPGPDGRVTTHVDLSKKAGEAHLFFSDRACDQVNPKMKVHVGILDQAFHDGGQESTNTVINSGDTLCVSVIGTISMVTP